MLRRRSCLLAGSRSRASIYLDARVSHNSPPTARKGSLFDTLEDSDVDACAAKLKELKALA